MTVMREPGLSTGSRACGQHGVADGCEMIGFVPACLLMIRTQHVTKVLTKSAGMLPKCYQIVTKLLPKSAWNVTEMLPKCYQIVTKMWQVCYHYVTKLLPNVTKLLPKSASGVTKIRKSRGVVVGTRGEVVRIIRQDAVQL